MDTYESICLTYRMSPALKGNFSLCSNYNHSHGDDDEEEDGGNDIILGHV